MEKNLVEKVNEMEDFFNKVKEGKVKTKDLKIPRKAKVRKSKIKKGWIGLLKVDENMNISGTKVQLEGGTFDIKENTWHATDGSEVLFWKGKFPILIQPTWAKNPLNIKKEKPNQETYGQKPIMAKMIKATLVKGKKAGGALLWIVLGIIAVVAISMLSKGGT